MKYVNITQHIPKIFHIIILNFNRIYTVDLHICCCFVSMCYYNVNIANFCIFLSFVCVHPNTVCVTSSEWHKHKMLGCHVNNITVVAEVATQKTPFGYETIFVIMMEIKHQHWAIYLPLRTTHNNTSLLTPEALAQAQSILPRAMMPSSGCNIFNNNIAELSSREACCI